MVSNRFYGNGNYKSLIFVLYVSCKTIPIKRVCFYIVAALSIYAAAVGIRIGRGLFPIQVAVSVASGAVGIAAIVIDRTIKGDEKKLKIARIMAATTLVIGIINTFM